MDRAFASLEQDSNLDRAASDYDRDGVIRVRGLLSPADIALVRAALARYKLSPHSCEGEHVSRPCPGA
jgi:hypothetical protein